MGGKGGSSTKVKIGTNPLEQKQVDIANRQLGRVDLLNQQLFDPVRQTITPQLLSALGTNPFQTKLGAAERAGYEGQYNQAKQAIMNTAERGGALRSRMAGLERDRANAIAGASQAARDRGIQRALQFTAGMVPTTGQQLGMEQAASGGIGSALSSAQQRALAEMEMRAKAQQGKGQGVGSLIGTGIGAAAAFGF